MLKPAISTILILLFLVSLSFAKNYVLEHEGIKRIVTVDNIVQTTKLINKYTQESYSVKSGFAYIGCDNPGHGHLPNNHYGTEATVDGVIDIIKWSDENWDILTQQPAMSGAPSEGNPYYWSHFKELKAFKKAEINAGETKKIKLKVNLHDCGYYNNRGEYLMEPGKFDIMIGSSSKDIKFLKTIEII